MHLKGQLEGVYFIFRTSYLCGVYQIINKMLCF